MQSQKVFSPHEKCPRSSGFPASTLQPPARGSQDSVLRLIGTIAQFVGMVPGQCDDAHHRPDKTISGFQASHSRHSPPSRPASRTPFFPLNRLPIPQRSCTALFAGPDFQILSRTDITHARQNLVSSSPGPARQPVPAQNPSY
jgi:hypothetical protein